MSKRMKNRGRDLKWKAREKGADLQARKKGGSAAAVETTGTTSTVAAPAAAVAEEGEPAKIVIAAPTDEEVMAHFPPELCGEEHTDSTGFDPVLYALSKVR